MDFCWQCISIREASHQTKIMYFEVQRISYMSPLVVLKLYVSRWALTQKFRFQYTSLNHPMFVRPYAPGTSLIYQIQSINPKKVSLDSALNGTYVVLTSFTLASISFTIASKKPERSDFTRWEYWKQMKALPLLYPYLLINWFRKCHGDFCSSSSHDSHEFAPP